MPVVRAAVSSPLRQLPPWPGRHESRDGGGFAAQSHQEDFHSGFTAESPQKLRRIFLGRWMGEYQKPARSRPGVLNSGAMSGLGTAIRDERRSECKTCVCSMWRDPSVINTLVATTTLALRSRYDGNPTAKCEADGSRPCARASVEVLNEVLGSGGLLG